jgi:hypothetical protein
MPGKAGGWKMCAGESWQASKLSIEELPYNGAMEIVVASLAGEEIVRETVFPETPMKKLIASVERAKFGTQNSQNQTIKLTFQGEVLKESLQAGSIGLGKGEPLTAVIQSCSETEPELPVCDRFLPFEERVRTGNVVHTKYGWLSRTDAFALSL